VLLILLSPAALATTENPPEPPPDKVAEAFAKASPEHKLAMLEARRWLPESDESVAEARTLLGKVDRLYVEDSEKITSLVELFWRYLRSEGQEASAFKILEGATAWREPGYFKDGRREFEEFIAVYAAVRIGREGRPGLEHEEAIERMRASGASEG
jgi:hypothetical protein